jgi:hypothetical protein
MAKALKAAKADPDAMRHGLNVWIGEVRSALRQLADSAHRVLATASDETHPLNRLLQVHMLDQLAGALEDADLKASAVYVRGELALTDPLAAD